MIERPAVQNDTEELIALLRQMHEEIGLWSLDEAALLNTVTQRIKENGVCIIEDDGEIIATIGLHAYRVWYSGSYVLQDQWLFIREDYRTLDVFKRLISSAMTCSRMMDLPLIICLHTVKDHDRKDILFRRYMDQVMKAYRFEPCGGQYETGVKSNGLL